MKARHILFQFLFGLLALHASAQYNWQKLLMAPVAITALKQDDIYFVTPETGWSINGDGNIYKTTDGGATWVHQLNQPGTYFRCVGFIDSMVGFAGNIGTGYYPGVTDANPLYRTTDGGKTWSAVTNISGPQVKGLCAINVVDKNVIYAGGRVGGPTFIIKSTDGGNSWTSKDMSGYCGMILDMKFFSSDTGFVFAATDANGANSHATVLYTTDGGNNFTTVYTSSRTGELCWKGYMVSRQVGYLTILSSDASNSNRYVAKTIDGGKSWMELPFTTNGAKEFGIGFLTEKVGWVGTDNSGYETTDGGNSWHQVNMGTFVNKIRLIGGGNNIVAYAIGLNIYKLNTQWPAKVSEVVTSKDAFVFYPNPAKGSVNFSINMQEKIAMLEICVYNTVGKLCVKEKVVPALVSEQDNGFTYRASISDHLFPGIYNCIVKYGDKTVSRMIECQ